MSLLNNKIKELTPYEPLKGDYKIRLDANESFINLPAEKKEGISKLMLKVDYNRYPDPLAADVCKAFGDFFGINSDFLTAGNGSDELISIIINCFADKGDKVLCLSPDFSMYRFYSSLAELKIAELPKDENLCFNLSEVNDIIKKETPRIVIFSNPCNPTGQGIEKEELINLISSNSCIFVIDEAYMDFWDETLIGCFENYKNLIILKTCSKAFGLATIRLGFAIAEKNLNNALRAVKSPFNVNSITQEIGAFILSDKEYLNNCIEEIKKSRDYLYNALKKFDNIEVLPTKTNFAVVKTEKAFTIYEELLKKKIAVRCFDGFLRITAGTQEENEELIKELGGILNV